MILKLHKIPDRIIFRIIFALLVLWNLKYVFLIFQVPFTLMFVDFKDKNAFYSQVTEIKQSIRDIDNFQDEGKIGFVSDTNHASVFDTEDSIRDFYLTQYAIVPSVLKNDTKQQYVIGTFSKNEINPEGFKTLKKINNKTYLYIKEK